MQRLIVASLAGLALVALTGCLPPAPEGIGDSADLPSADSEIGMSDVPPDETIASDEGEWLDPAPAGGAIEVEPIDQSRVRVSQPEPVAKASATPSRASGYVVPKGKTLYAIAREHGVSVKALIAANGLSEPYHLAAGQTISIPSGETALANDDRPVDLRADQPKQATPALKVAAVEDTASRKAPKPVRRPAIKVAGPVEPAVVRGGKEPAKAEPASARIVAGGPPPRAGEGFLWPVKGPIVAKFGKLGGGKQSDGIIIAVPVGTPVRAAENGVVVYAGDDLKAYGQLLLVRHADGWMTAYANNDKLKVNQGEVVKRGQVIAETGATGNVKGPQTYFEIRHDGRPVDPIPRLAES